MTSDELIEILKKHPGKIVKLYDWNEHFAEPTNFDEKDIFIDEEITLGVMDEL